MYNWTQELKLGFPAMIVAIILSLSIISPIKAPGLMASDAEIIGSDMQQSWPSGALPSSISYGMRRTFTNAKEATPVSVATTNTIASTNITISNISVQSVPVIIETYSSYPVQANDTHNLCFFQEIKVPCSVYIPWVNIFIEYLNLSVGLDEWRVSIYNATFGFPDPKPIPDKEVPGCYNDNVNPRWEIMTGLGQYISHWENVTMPLVLLDTSNTVYYGGVYHFFIAVTMPSNNGEQQLWFFSTDGDGLGDDYGTAFYAAIDPLNEGDTKRVFPVEYPGIDFCVITKFIPGNSTPSPSEIFMKIDDEPVVYAGSGSGYYNSTAEQFPDEGRISYEISSAWSDLFPGTMTCDVVLDYELKVLQNSDILVFVNETEETVSWQADFTITVPTTSTSDTATLMVEFPLSWHGLVVINMTMGNDQVYGATSISTSNDGRKSILKASALTSGTWRLIATSEVLPVSLDIDIPSTGLGLDDTLTGTATVVNGPNGQVARLASGNGLDGRTANLTILKGTSNSSNNEALLDATDSKSIAFYNKTGQDLKEILLKILMGIPVSEYEIESCVDVDFTLPEGFKMENIHDLDVNIMHAIPAESWWYGNITGGTCPSNPLWNPAYVDAGDALELLIFYDMDYIPVNFTYNVTEQRWADFYVNYSIVILNEDQIEQDKIKDINIDIVTYFKFDDVNHEIFIKNQSSPTGDYVLLQNVQKSREYANHSRMTWTSKDDPSFNNISQYIKPGTNNIVELFFRTYNLTQVSMPWQLVGVDMAALNFTFINDLRNFTVSACNWTDGQFFPIGTNLTIPYEMAVTHLDLLGFVGNMADIFDPNTGKIRIKLNLTGRTPLFNVLTWCIDAINVNMTYTNVMRCNWTQAVWTHSTNENTYVHTSTTLLDSPSNNQTVFIPALDMLSYDDEYRYTMFWTNGSDVGLATRAFSIKRHVVAMSIVQGIRTTHHQLGTTIVVKSALTYASNSSEISAKPVIMNVEARLRDGNEINISIPSYTGEDGISPFSIQPEDSWATFTYSIRFNDTDPRFKPAGISANSTYVIETPMEYAGRIIVENIIAIIAAASIVVIVLVVKSTSDAKQRKSWKRDSDKIRDVVKIQHLMVIMKDSGSCVVNRSYTPQQLDADLVSGFLHAITTFGREIGPKSANATGEGVTFDYQHFKILILDGQHVRLALILDGNPTEGMKSNGKAFLAYFEQAHDLSSWKGNLDIFDSVDNLIEQAFEITLVYPLVVNSGKAPKTIKSKLGRALHEVGMAVQKEKRVFYLATLLNFAKAGRKESEDQVLADIYRLKKDGYFTFFSPAT